MVYGNEERWYWAAMFSGSSWQCWLVVAVVAADGSGRMYRLCHVFMALVPPQPTKGVGTASGTIGTFISIAKKEMRIEQLNGRTLGLGQYF